MKNETAGCPCCVGVAGFSFLSNLRLLSLRWQRRGERGNVSFAAVEWALLRNPTLTRPPLTLIDTIILTLCNMSHFNESATFINGCIPRPPPCSSPRRVS
ncbi:hypothetical protein CEXT_88721 [Caerostris extrusa]|uniref:Uncharacterized protein n=1 Tax=Caerostris extrusa TaxID=172846 RepID=A0AAV4X918_CAEEX|nr:hypothetical protein CEXT_88721 [Caerostris extrusa]